MMTNENTSYSQHPDFLDWCDKWDKAQEAGIFDDAPKPHVPTQNVADHSFFGPTDTKTADVVKDVDAEYWSQVYQVSTGQEPEKMIAEGNPVDEVVGKQRAMRPATEIIPENPPLRPAPGWNKEDTAAASKVSRAVGTAANPIYSNTVGKDQDINMPQLDATWGAIDLEALSEMKLKLHDLENRLNASDGLVQSGRKYQTQIQNLRQQVDDLSDRLTRTFPDQSAP